MVCVDTANWDPRENKHYIQRAVRVDYRTMTDGKCRRSTILASCFSPSPQDFGLQSGENGWGLKGREREAGNLWVWQNIRTISWKFKFIDRRSV